MKYAIIALLLALAVASSACAHKKNKVGTALPPADNVGQFDNGLVITGYDPVTGEPIYGDGASDMMRLDGAELGAGQFEAVYFDYDSPQLNPAEQAKIDAVVAYLQQNPTLGVIIEGHCDERGSNEYNLSLGERRALHDAETVLFVDYRETEIRERDVRRDQRVSADEQNGFFLV